MKHSEVALLEVSLTDKATQWLAEKIKQYNDDTKVAVVLWLNVSSS